MRTELTAELDRLTVELGEMCAIAATMVRDATPEIARLDALNSSVEHRAFVVLALHAPVAHDLRAVVAALSIAADAHRMGGLAAIITTLDTPASAADIVSEMRARAYEFARSARRAVLSEDIDEAHHIEDDDATMNDLHRALLAEVLDGNWEYGVGSASDVAVLGRCYERFADHAVHIARNVMFSRTGQRVPISPEV